MESYILLSELNDFIFCPRSIYWHHIYGRYTTSAYHKTDQILGNIAHKTIDTQTYSTRKNILQWTSIYSDILKIAWKIDLFDTKTGVLTERKRKIKKIYSGYLLQLYGQYICLSEMWYVITGIRFHSTSDNKTYLVPLPGNQEIQEFQSIIDRFHRFRLDNQIKPNRKKCERCIYSWLCDQSII